MIEIPVHDVRRGLADDDADSSEQLQPVPPPPSSSGCITIATSSMVSPPNWRKLSDTSVKRTWMFAPPSALSEMSYSWNDQIGSSTDRSSKTIPCSFCHAG